MNPSLLRKTKSAVLVLLALASPAFGIKEPPQFTLNCKACHLLDQVVVGPSLVEMAKIYRDKPEEFLKWTVTPGKKRPLMPQMPSMAHVPAEDIKTIYNYIQEATKGVKEQKKNSSDPFANFAHATRRPHRV